MSDFYKINLRRGDVYRLHQTDGNNIAVGDSIEVAQLVTSEGGNVVDWQHTMRTVARINFMAGARNKYHLVDPSGELLGEIPAETVIQAICFVIEEGTA